MVILLLRKGGLERGRPFVFIGACVSAESEHLRTVRFFGLATAPTL